MLIRRAVGSGVVVVRGRLHGRGSITLRCASGAQSAVQRASGARSGACSGAERSKALCALVDLAHLRVLAWEAGFACAAPLACSFTFLGDGSFLFVVALHSIGRWAISSLACPHRSLDHPEGVSSSVERCHANSKDASTITPTIFFPRA